MRNSIFENNTAGRVWQRSHNTSCAWSSAEIPGLVLCFWFIIRNSMFKNNVTGKVWQRSHTYELCLIFLTITTFGCSRIIRRLSLAAVSLYHKKPKTFVSVFLQAAAFMLSCCCVSSVVADLASTIRYVSGAAMQRFMTNKNGIPVFPPSYTLQRTRNSELRQSSLQRLPLQQPASGYHPGVSGGPRHVGGLWATRIPKRYWASVNVMRNEKYKRDS